MSIIHEMDKEEVKEYTEQFYKQQKLLDIEEDEFKEKQDRESTKLVDELTDALVGNEVPYKGKMWEVLSVYFSRCGGDPSITLKNDKIEIELLVIDIFMD